MQVQNPQQKPTKAVIPEQRENFSLIDLENPSERAVSFPNPQNSVQMDGAFCIPWKSHAEKKECKSDEKSKSDENFDKMIKIFSQESDKG